MVLDESTSNDKNENQIIKNPTIEKVEKKPKTLEFAEYPNLIELNNRFIDEQRYRNINRCIYDASLELAPIHLEDLLSFMLPFYGREKITQKFRQIFRTDLLTASRIHPRINFEGDFICLHGEPIKFRTNSGRPLKRIFSKEIADGILEHLKNVSKMKITDLFKIFANFCGYSSVSKEMYLTLEKALNHLKREGSINVDEEYVWKAQ